MLSQFRTSYQRVEQSLQRLTDSIAAYNPSTTAANELVAADEEVNAHLEQLFTHQSNHLRILELRQTSEKLDDTLRRTIQLLADARKDLLSIPTYNAVGDARREIGVNEVLAYAKFISKTTVPPTFRKRDVPAQYIKREASDAQITNGIATPPHGAQEPVKAERAEVENVGIQAMDANAKNFIDPLKDLPFEPWPSYEVIQRGALADIQRMVEQGQDPASVLTADEQLEADRKKQEEEERERSAQEEAERRRMSMFDTAAVARRATMADVFNPDDL